MNLGVINFTGGVFTPKIDVRSDTERYSSGCRILQNMIPKIYGGAERRTGSEFISTSVVATLILSYILAYENIGLCYENNIVHTKDSVVMPDLLCWENDIVCYNNEVVSTTDYFFESNIVCYENNVLFYENEIVWS